MISKLSIGIIIQEHEKWIYRSTVAHIGNVNRNLFVAGESESFQICSIKIIINSPPSTRSHCSTMRVSLGCNFSPSPLLDISNSKGVSFMCWPVYAPLQSTLRVGDLTALYYTRLWLTDVIFTVQPFGLCSSTATRDWKNPSQQSWQSQQLHSQSLEAVKSKWDILKAFLFFYYMYPRLEQEYKWPEV